MVRIFVKSMLLRFKNSSFTCWILDYCPDEAYERIDINSEIDRIVAKAPRRKLPEVSKTGEMLKMLHVTDIHFDPQYQEGSLVKCDAILCCREMPDSEMPEDTERAGEYGSLGHCDIPFKTVVHFFDHVFDPDSEWPDVILWTGDNPAHNIW